MESPKKFSIRLTLPDLVDIYNNNIHTTTILKPINAFKLQDEKSINKWSY